MSKIEIYGTPKELERIAIFLENNNLSFKIKEDVCDPSIEKTNGHKNRADKYTALLK